MTYEVIDRETSIRIDCPSGGFDVTDSDGKINVRKVHVIVAEGSLAEVTLIGFRYKANGKIGERVAHTNAWPEPHSEPNAEDAHNFVLWSVLPTALQQVIVSEVQS